ncbi:MAG: 4'-phosphopantetheinyl transferase superfamily protein [Drouetiella hepatica Uher 2000/2452]|jgi:4'-phosphopantetheinyl transferase|uniref:4'-phosphopantetheinyl transferase superfamily protein n=1 Tax=Drouetiella hepatica Uher 2000/2452 TaxID=904376 RepID=A0A951QBC9_9CYAN|nr:4'-phosphopantetheinyl transferase superfamily protein [Drouetiella hepatica Uher 2000/2452]
MNNLMPEWVLPPENLALLSNEVHVWQASLRQPPEQVERLAKLLSVEEQDRAARFRRERDRLHFISGRGLLREMLGRYLAIAPAQIQFGYGDHGKPFVVSAPELKLTDLQFNMSHGHELALYAIGRDRPVGIDVEYVRRPVADLEQLTQRFFSKREHATLLALPPHQRVKTFFRGWTCKEAYLKAIGTGLTELDQVEVALTPDIPPKLILSSDSTGWWLHILEPQPDYTAALVAAIAEPSQPPHLHYWRIGSE